MDFTRRGFLGLLLAGTAGLALPKDALWMPSSDLSLPALTPEAIVGLRQATMEIARQLSQRIDGHLVEGFDLKIGQSGMSQQFACDMSMYPTDIDHYGLDRERYLNPIAAALAARIESTRCDRFGRLSLPVMDGQSVQVAGAGVAVRGIAQNCFDPELGPITRVRFDVLCGRA